MYAAALLTGALLLILVACGGGGGSSSPGTGSGGGTGGNGGIGAGGDPTPPGDVTADFGSRTTVKFAIPQEFLGANLGFANNNFYQNTAALKQLAGAGVVNLRVSADLQDVFLTQTPDWSVIDPIISGLQAGGIRPTINMDFTPPWLQPSNNTLCGDPNQAYHEAPTDPNAWGQIAAQFLAHMDQAFPNFIVDYEIWNEPDSPTGLCTMVNSDSARISAYKAMFAAAGKAMQARAATDHVAIRIGGPGLTQPTNATTWLPALLNDSTTAQYVDFVSYHHYLAGNASIAQGLAWDTGPQQLLAKTQDPQFGIQAQYVAIAKMVAAGLQPNAATTPIYLDEYNTTASFEPDCCRNSPIYGPLWNALLINDALHGVYAGANVPPSKLQYFAGQAWFPTTTTGAAWFCLIGILDARMDCAYDPAHPATSTPYPQFYAYDLIGGSTFLGLSQGGKLANSLAMSSAAGPVVASAFYTSARMSVVLVNPTAADTASLVIKLQNSGTLNAAGAIMYTLNQANPQIAAKNIALTSLSDGFKVSVVVPHYSVVAISVPL
jgi:Glycosyl hydrolases family 39